ncbi:MAG: tRNA epoxyqueuosine(34) reductase QueG [Bacteroidetes bacterium]|nr:tRNA epoxyqueuosine(34) reductase QueG [Bacteroidota bacterium]
MTLSNKIKSIALDIGFSKVGITSANIDENEIQNLNEWFNKKYDASMSWMHKSFEKRIDPKKILPNVKSIICVALNYYTNFEHSTDLKAGKISRYAWGTDYHLVMEKMLKKFKIEIEKLAPESKNKIYVDTGPVMEKYFSQKSGIGWRGKHTNVISKDFGSWIFLGEILTTLDLDYNAPMEDFCGTCTACLDACPTNAIVEPYLVDSNKCISYLTIEHKDEFKNINYDFKNWVYGCDICQDVCPWNSNQRESIINDFMPRTDNINPQLEKIIEMDSETFKKQFNKSPIKRTKISGLKRNAKYIVLSN